MSIFTTSTGLYRSCAALANFSGTFDFISFQALNIEFIVEKVFSLLWLSLVWVGLLIPQTHKQINNYLILINLICEFVLGYSTNKQTNKIIIYLYLI